MKLREQCIVIVSNEAWSQVWYSKHNYACALAKENKVIFIDPPSRWHPSDLLGFSFSLEEITESLYVLKYRNKLPSLNSFLFRLNNWLVTKRLRRFLDKEGIGSVLFWSFDPFRLYDPERLGASDSIYQCMDNYAFKHQGEVLLAKNCNHIVCVGESLAAPFRSFHDSVHTISHAIPNEAFDAGDPSLLKLPAAPGYGLFVGNINDRFDFALLERLLIAFPQHQFVMLGPYSPLTLDEFTRRVMVERQYPNLVVHEPVPYSQLKHYITAAGFGFIFLKPDNPGNRISSQKILQYFAQGKPVLSTPFSEWEQADGLIEMSEDSTALIERLQHLLKDGEPLEKAKKRKVWASQFRFARQLEYIESILSKSDS